MEPDICEKTAKRGFFKAEKYGGMVWTYAICCYFYKVLHVLQTQDSTSVLSSNMV